MASHWHLWSPIQSIIPIDFHWPNRWSLQIVCFQWNFVIQRNRSFVADASDRSPVHPNIWRVEGMGKYASIANVRTVRWQVHWKFYTVESTVDTRQAGDLNGQIFASMKRNCRNQRNRRRRDSCFRHVLNLAISTLPILQMILPRWPTLNQCDGSALWSSVDLHWISPAHSHRQSGKCSRLWSSASNRFDLTPDRQHCWKF